MTHTHTVRQACKILNVGRTKFYGLLASGELTAIRLGRKVLVTQEELTRFLTALPPVLTPTRRRRTAM